jgi:hypothetical protein
MKRLPIRPTHTGTARAEAIRPTRTKRASTYLRVACAAIALDPEESEVVTEIPVQWAVDPLPLSGGARLLATRVHPTLGRQGLVRQPGQRQGAWRPWAKLE